MPYYGCKQTETQPPFHSHCLKSHKIVIIYVLSTHRYPQKSDKYFTDSSLDAITNNFNLQMAKLGNGLLSGDYSKQQQQSSSQSDAVQYVVRAMRDTVGCPTHITHLLALIFAFFAT